MVIQRNIQILMFNVNTQRYESMIHGEISEIESINMKAKRFFVSSRLEIKKITKE